MVVQNIKNENDNSLIHLSYSQMFDISRNGNIIADLCEVVIHVP